MNLATFVKDHLTNQSRRWRVGLAINLFLFVAFLLFIPPQFMVIPTAWAVGYLLGMAYVENKWKRKLDDAVREQQWMR